MWHGMLTGTSYQNIKQTLLKFYYRDGVGSILNELYFYKIKLIQPIPLSDSQTITSKFHQIQSDSQTMLSSCPAEQNEHTNCIMSRFYKLYAYLLINYTNANILCVVKWYLFLLPFVNQLKLKWRLIYWSNWAFRCHNSFRNEIVTLG